MKLLFQIGGKSYAAALTLGDYAAQIAAMCPFEASYQPSGGHEFYARLPLAVHGQAEETSRVRKNALYCFAPWNALSIVTKDTDISPYGVVHLGDFEEDIAATLAQTKGSETIRCEVTEDE